MSSCPSTPPSPSPEVNELREELATTVGLLQAVRKNLILSQITVLELQDTILQKETDKADAVALLGRAELALEGKIDYIFELDRVLNAEISRLKQALSAAESTRNSLGAELAAAHAAHEQDRAARDAIAQDLVRKLDETNRALGAAHELAARYASEASEAREHLATHEPERTTRKP